MQDFSMRPLKERLLGAHFLQAIGHRITIFTKKIQKGRHNNCLLIIIMLAFIL